VDVGPALESRPYGRAQLRRRDVASTLVAKGVDATASAGLDLKWHLTSNLTVDATVNPDFVQVEPDEAVLNLRNVETYFPEKRAFFLDGVETFSTPRPLYSQDRLVYTRRIGRITPPPVLRVVPPYGERLVDVPAPAPILAASKITGKLASGWTIGSLQAVTTRNDVEVLLSDASVQKRLIDPLSSFGILRIKREFDGHEYLGLVLTAAAHAEPTGSYPLLHNAQDGFQRQLCPTGVEITPGARCFDNAYVAALDGGWRSPGGDYAVGGMITASMLDQGPARTQRDGTVIQPGELGMGGFVYASKEAGKHWIGNLWFQYAGRKLDYNDLGYSERSNHLTGAIELEYRVLQRWRGILESHARLSYFVQHTVAGLPAMGNGYYLWLWAKLPNFWRFDTGIYYLPRRFDDREVGDGTALERRWRIGPELSLTSDFAKALAFWIRTWTYRLVQGVTFDSDSGIAWRGVPQVTVDLSSKFSYAAGEPRYAATENGVHIFGQLEAKSLSVTLRTSYAFTPSVTVEAYGQLFLASGHFSHFRTSEARPGLPEVISIASLQEYGGALMSNPDFQNAIFLVNATLRWEYRLGSTLFFVYTRSQAPVTVLMQGESANLSPSSLTRAPAADVWLVKLSYWWN
jgi:hypothetical protein